MQNRFIQIYKINMNEYDNNDEYSNPSLHQLMCPISLALMQTPVIIKECGHTFERLMITQTLNKFGKCPTCNKTASVQDLQINYFAKNITEAHKQSLNSKLIVDYSQKQVCKFEVIILGDTGVGKTCLIKQFVDNTFNSKQQSTTRLQSSVAKLQVDSKIVQLKFSDIGGSKQYIHLIKQQLKYKCGILLVYSINDYKSFINLQIWLKLIKQYAIKNIPIILIANKHDLAIIQNNYQHKQKLNEDLEIRDVTKQQGVKFANKNNLTHYECSSKGFDCIKVIFHALAKQIIKKVSKRQILINEKQQKQPLKLKHLNALNPQLQTPSVDLNSSDIKLVFQEIASLSQIQQDNNKKKQKNLKNQEEIIKISQQVNNYDIKKVINQYYDQTLKKIKKRYTTTYLFYSPQFQYKISKQNNQSQLKKIVINAFKLFKIQVNQYQLQIIKDLNQIKIVSGNYLIQWSYNNDWFYFGQRKLKQNNKMLNGYGLRIKNKSGIYVGDFKDNKLHGKGKYCSEWEQIYQGDYKDDARDGFGKQFKNVCYYQGGWKDGYKHGKGKVKYLDANGRTYQGDWINGKFNGKRKECYADGSNYQGDWQDDKQHGRGKYCYADGSRYEGDWKNGKYHGQGKYSYGDGQNYQGEWKDGKFHGKGKFSFASGSTYYGGFQNGKQHGSAKTIFKNGKQFDQLWQYGKKKSSRFNDKKQKITNNRFKCDQCFII